MTKNLHCALIEPVNKKRILLIEDDKSLCRLYKIVLNDAGILMDESHDGKTGLTKALHGDYDLIVLDLMLPIMNGFDVLKILREKNHTKNLPIIILTNLSGPEIEEVKEWHVSAFILKASATPVQLVEQIKNVLK